MKISLISQSTTTTTTTTLISNYTEATNFTLQLKVFSESRGDREALPLNHEFYFHSDVINKKKLDMTNYIG